MSDSMRLNYLGEKKAAENKKAVMNMLKEGKVRTADLNGSSTTNEISVAIASKARVL